MALGRKTGGRKVGSVNKAPKERVAAAARMGLLPHEFLLAVCRGEPIPVDGGGFVKPDLAMRIDAAKAAAPYYAPKLSNVEHTGKGGGPIETLNVTDEHRARALAAFLAKTKAGAQGE